MHKNTEKLVGIIERITFHNPQNGWTVMKVAPFNSPGKLVPVVIHQAKVFAGATMEFYGNYSHHPKHGEQFTATQAVEKKPATTAALEKYLGSGLIKGVGPAIAKRVVGHFKDQTLNVFENKIEELLKIPGIAEKKLALIKNSWVEHKAIRDVMIFLQSYGISTLFATKIFKHYGDKSISTVSENPYRLAHDIYGIGFFSADKVALSMGLAKDGPLRIEAGIKHILASSREEGHCYLTENQILEQTKELLREELEEEKILALLKELLTTNQIKSRKFQNDECYYSKSLYFDELFTAQKMKDICEKVASIDSERVITWVSKYCQTQNIQLSAEQNESVCEIPKYFFSILTGGPGCGKTTTTKVLVNLLKAMKKRVLLAAPTGRASQRMSEVIGMEAKTIHRLLEWAPHLGDFHRGEKNPLEVDFLIVDETSMLDISLTWSLLKAVPVTAQVLFIGDPDQLPAVGAGNVLTDLLSAKKVKRFKLTQVFRQAQSSDIIRYAHQINAGSVPKVLSPIKHPEAFKQGHDCFFMDADEATMEQIKFVQKVKHYLKKKEDQVDDLNSGVNSDVNLLEQNEETLYSPELKSVNEVKEPQLVIPDKFKHVDLEKLILTKTNVEELFQVLKKIHPWSSLHFGLTALDTLIRLYTKTIPEWLGEKAEIQVLSPQVRGTLGTINLNMHLQNVKNPEHELKRQLVFGEKILRVGDRVIQTRNNYDLGVYNGDIGHIQSIDLEEMTCEVRFQGGDSRSVIYEREDMTELSLAYAITIHKSQGSEFQVVIIPVLSQHFNMLFRNLIYTGLTRAKKLAIFVGSRKAFSMAIGQIDNRKRQTLLSELIS